MDLETTKARIAAIEDEEARLAAERAPIDEKIRKVHAEWNALTDQKRPFDHRQRDLSDERRRLENHLIWLGQSGEVGDSWRAYLAGELETIIIATPSHITGRQEREVRPVRIVGDWAVHRVPRGPDDRDDDRDRWAVTHGPSGMRALAVDTEASALGLAVQLRDITADPAPGADNSAASAIVARHRKAMAR
jgi:hypothetical protein